MQRNIHIDESEKFLREKADQYKLYPSDKVWSNINRSIHPRRKWPYVALTLFLLLGTAVFVDYNGYNYVLPGKNVITQTSTSPSSNIEPAYISTKNNSSVKKAIAENENSPVSAQIHNKQLTVNTTTIEASSPSTEQIKIFVNKPDTKAGTASDDNYNNVTAAFLKALNDKKSIITKKKARDVQDEEPVRKVLWKGEAFKKSKFKWQISFSPTVSYRKLTSGLSQVTDIFRGVPYSNVQGNTSVNSLVTQKPAIGAEVGANLVYKLSDNFVIKGGLQFNYSRYQLKAYSSKPQIATVALDNNRGGTDSLSFISTMENHEGRGSSWYNNEYLQISLPVGFEWSVLGNSNFKWNIGASAQPVYNFANNVYLLSTDFKHYVQDPSLIRKWNINAAMETFISYDMGSFKWQIGPQLRYQLMSSYRSEYPIKEHMVDVGFKIGITKTLK
jgi:hypothetical protein